MPSSGGRTALVALLLLAALPSLALGKQTKLKPCKKGCSERGVCNLELGRCDCPKGWQGEDCSEQMTPEAMQTMCMDQNYHSVEECQTMPLPCLNACNGKGDCTYGFCHCKEGYYGADCSLSMDEDGQPQLLHDEGYKPRKKGPHVYVYELPPEFNQWHNSKRVDRPIPYMFWQRLLSSGSRVADPEDADWFFIPIKVRGVKDSDTVVKAIKYIRQTWPFYNETEGDRHFTFHIGDMGTAELSPDAQKAAAEITWLTHWGLHEDNELSQWRSAFSLHKDMVVPVYLSPSYFPRFGFDESPLHPKFKGPYAPGEDRPRTFFFAGRICGDRMDPDTNVTTGGTKTAPYVSHCQSDKSVGYSAGVRQQVHFYHHNRSSYMVATRVKAYDSQLRRSKFCLAPAGGGHGQRNILVSFLGCVPVPIGDYIYQPFEPELDWSKFAVQAAESQIPELHTILDGVTDGELKRMQAALKCAAQHFVYSSITGGFLGDDGRYDAFETILQILRVKVKYPLAAPYEYVDLDKDFRRFMYCGADEIGGEPAEAKHDPYAHEADEWLCSHSKLDRSREKCQSCLRGMGGSHGVPGGMVCCDSTKNLAKCIRMWE